MRVRDRTRCPKAWAFATHAVVGAAVVAVASRGYDGDGEYRRRDVGSRGATLLLLLLLLVQLLELLLVV